VVHHILALHLSPITLLIASGLKFEPILFLSIVTSVKDGLSKGG